MPKNTGIAVCDSVRHLLSYTVVVCQGTEYDRLWKKIHSTLNEKPDSARGTIRVVNERGTESAFGCEFKEEKIPKYLVFFVDKFLHLI